VLRVAREHELTTEDYESGWPATSNYIGDVILVLTWNTMLGSVPSDHLRPSRASLGSLGGPAKAPQALVLTHLVVTRSIWSGYGRGLSSHQTEILKLGLGKESSGHICRYEVVCAIRRTFGSVIRLDLSSQTSKYVEGRYRMRGSHKVEILYFRFDNVTRENSLGKLHFILVHTADGRLGSKGPMKCASSVSPFLHPFQC